MSILPGTQLALLGASNGSVALKTVAAVKGAFQI
jgi:hypothetical protein